MAQNTVADDRTDTQKVQMARFFAEERAEYENADGYTIVYEDDVAAVVADHTGHELNEWANRFDIDRDTLRQTMRALAEQKLAERDAHDAFSYADPVVFDKLES